MPLDLNNPEVKAEVDAIVATAKSGLEKKVNELLDELKPLRSKVRELDGVDPEEFKRLKEEAEKRDEEAARKSGEFDRLRDQLRESHKKEVEGKDTRISALTKALEKEAVEAAIVRELGRAGATEEGLELLPGRLAASVRVVEEEGQFVARVFDGDKVALNDEGKPKTVEALVADVKTKYPSSFSAAGGSGGGYRGGSGGGGGGTLTLEQVEKMSPAEYSKARREGLIR